MSQPRNAKEDREEFEHLLEKLRRAWKPRDVVEESLVCTLAECEWRLRRAGELR
jgi:hypothetical protein